MGEADLTFNSDFTAEGSFDTEISNQIKNNGLVQTIKVKMDTVDNQVKKLGLPLPDFVKIDVEGFEVPVLQGMVKTVEACKPMFYVEVHGASAKAKRDNALGVTIFLLEMGYCMYHVETRHNLNLNNSSIASRGHIFAF